MIEFVNSTLGILTLLTQIALLIGVLYFLINRKKTNDPFINFLGKHGILSGFLISFVGTIFSLFYSLYAGYEPCTLCWYQRIFFYPLVIIFGIALLKKDKGKEIIDYALALAMIGAIIALYHNYIDYGGTAFINCDSAGLGASCTKRYVFELGHIGIPLMSFTSFLTTIFILVVTKIYKKKSITQ